MISRRAALSGAGAALLLSGCASGTDEPAAQLGEGDGFHGTRVPDGPALPEVTLTDQNGQEFTLDTSPTTPVVMVFFVVFGNAFQGVIEADKYLIANARILGASPRQVTTAVVIPSAMSWILASLHVSFGFALVGAVVGEFLGAKQGMGLLISTAQGAFNASGVFAAMILLAAVALVADFVLTRLEKRLLKWRPAAF